jgi:SAM-dependent methyltransferase
MESLNIYGDSSAGELSGYGIDISLQRTDSLDIALLDEVKASQFKNLKVVDLGCGKGGQAVRLASSGCYVAAVDVQDFSKEIQESCKKNKIPNDRVTFIKCDIRNTSEYLSADYHYFYSQRTFHYLEYQDSEDLLKTLRQHFVKNFKGKLFISVSGIDSELGEGYDDKNKQVQYRFCQLSKEMRNKHKIVLPVCLFSLDEFRNLLLNCKYSVDEIYTSDFGNVKAIAKPPL